MEPFMGPKCFLSLSIFILTVLSIYGIVGLILNVFQSAKLCPFGDWPFNLRPMLYAFVGIQALFPMGGLFVILAVWKKNPMFLYGSGSVLLGVFTCSCVFGTVAYRSTITDIIDEFYTTLKKNANDSELLEWMNDIQWKHKCCGVYSYADYWSIKADESIVPFDGVHSSCCRRENSIPLPSCGENLLFLKAHGGIPVEEKIYTMGCGAKVAQTLYDSLQRIGLEIWIAGGVSLIVAIFLYVGITTIYLPATSAQSSEGDVGDDDPNGGRGNASRTISRRGKGRMSGSPMDQANNNPSTAGNAFGPSSSNKLGITGNRRKTTSRPKAKPTKFEFGSAFNAHPQRRSFNGTLLRRDVSSKSFILGEAHSHLIPASDGEGNPDQDQDLFRKNVDMLWYQSVEKNMSALSTTPNDISSINFPASFQNKKPVISPDLFNALNEERNTVYTLVSERPFTPSLSQNCSISFFNNYPIKVSAGNANGTEVPVTGQSSPLFSSSKQQRPPVHPNPPTRAEDEGPIVISEEHLEEVEQPLNELQVTPSTTLKPTTVESSDAKNDNQVDPVTPEEEETGSNESLISQMNAVTSGPPPAGQVSGKYPTSSVRSSTLATIQEESESSKGTPANNKGASPVSSYTSPEVSPSQTQAKLHTPPPAGSDSDGNLTNTITKDNPDASQCPSDQETVVVTFSATFDKMTPMDKDISPFPIGIPSVGPQEFTENLSIHEEEEGEESVKYPHPDIECDSNMNSKDKLPTLEEGSPSLSY